jgi:hypothetical protein
MSFPNLRNLAVRVYGSGVTGEGIFLPPRSLIRVNRDTIVIEKSIQGIELLLGVAIHVAYHILDRFSSKMDRIAYYEMMITIMSGNQADLKVRPKSPSVKSWKIRRYRCEVPVSLFRSSGVFNPIFRGDCHPH